ncbi:MAG TPA: hemolysin family protein [Ignavibacteriaceae bacterium]|jgi:CBS domain containing-hemolysin-like protein|nr:hemolysin family protein [Ignavibacteriaceae bacterium]
MASDFILLFVLLLFSGFFSGSEMAFVIANRIKIEIKSRKENIAAKSAMFFINHPERFFSTILIGNNITNIAFASVSAVIFYQLFQFTDWTILLVSTLILLLLGELIPKYIAREMAERFMLFSSLAIRFISLLLFPVVKIMESLSSKLSSNNVSRESISNLFTREDIEYLVNESQQAGTVNKTDSNIIKKVLDLREQRVYEAMRPRTEIVGVELDTELNDVVSVFIDSGYSKLPVYEENLDNIKGFILAYDLFTAPKNLKSILREIIFVPETKKSIDILNELLEKKLSIAVVVDEFGGTAGIVTMEDIIEELFGEIKDEYDVDENICKKIGENTFLISGKTEIDHLNETFDLNFPTGDYETVAGFITAKTGRIPLTNETITIDDYQILVVRANQVKIDLIKLALNKEEK